MNVWKKQLINTYVCMSRLLLGVNKKKVIFNSFSGKTYSDNPKAISEALHKEMPDAEIIWLFKTDKKQVVPEYVRCVDINCNIRKYRELATAAVYVSNFAIQALPKSKRQLFIQTWHGDKAFKRVLNDAPNAPKGRVLAEQISDYCNYAVAGSEYGKAQYRSAFRYEGEVLMIGTPRNDRLLNTTEQRAKEIKERIGIEENIKTLLYAPTLRKEAWKKNEWQEIKELDIPAIIRELEKRDQCKWICLMRAHPTAVGLNYQCEDKSIVDVSGYEDMADLLLISDMLITDYSSCAGDFALTGRPIVLFQADRQEYLDKERTFYFDMEDSPYFIAESQAELETILSQMTEEKAKENCKKILEFYGDCETGHASETVAKIIKDWIEG